MSSSQIIGIDAEAGKSVRVTCERGMIAGIEAIDTETDLHLSPGFIDLQVNGYGGFDINAQQVSIDTIVGLVGAMLANGVTCFAPTLITASEERICHALSVIAQARRLNDRVAECAPFVHVEGPHISPTDGYRGAHPEHLVRPPSIAEFDRWQQAGAGCVGIVTLSPHFAESSGYIRALIDRVFMLPSGTHMHRQSRLETQLMPGRGFVPTWAMELRRCFRDIAIPSGHNSPTIAWSQRSLPMVTIYRRMFLNPCSESKA